MDRVSRSISVKGTSFDYLDIGQGLPVILLHGALGDVRTFAPHCQMLSDRHRAITYTQRYFGTEPAEGETPPFGIDTHARDLADFVEALGLRQAFVVAWSYAGHVALRAAQFRPDLFHAMLVYETGFQTFMTDPAEIATVRADMETMFQPVFAAMRDGDNAAAARLLVNASAEDNHYFESRTDMQIRIELDNAHSMPKLLSRSAPPRISAEDLAQIEVPVTIACGAKSRPAYRLVSEAAMRILPGPHYTIPGVNHFWPDSEPGAFTDFVREWVSSRA